MSYDEIEKLNEQLRQLATEQQTILNTVSVGVAYVRDRKVQWVNRTFDKIFGYEAGETNGMDTAFFR
jgi:PAS domain-containing protein